MRAISVSAKYGVVRERIEGIREKVVPLDDLASAHTVVADRAHGTVVEPAEVLTVGTDDFGGSCSVINRRESRADED